LDQRLLIERYDYVSVIHQIIIGITEIQI